MKISYLQSLAIAVFGVLTPHALLAQNVMQQRLIATIDSKALNAELVFVGRIVTVAGKSGSVDAVISVDETLKGNAPNPHRLHVSDYFESSELKDIFKKNKTARLLVTGNNFTSLNSKDLAVPTASGDLLREPDQVIEYVREVLRTHPGVNHVETFVLDRKIFPVDERLEKWAVEDIRSGRTQGIDALKFFKSDANIALLRELLEDSRFTTQSAETNNGIEVRTYPVRQRAYAQLTSWSVEVAPPILREETPRLDTVERLVWKGSIENSVLERLAQAGKLKELEFSRNALPDSQVMLVSQITTLTRLKIPGQITDSSLKQLRRLANLQYLDLSMSRITDKGLSELAALRHLKKLTLTETRLSDEGLATLASIPALREIDNALTRTTKEAIAETRRLHPNLFIGNTLIFSKGPHELHADAFLGDVQAARKRLLLENAAAVDPNQLDYSGTAAIFYAVSQNQIDMVRLLLDHHARVDIVDAGNSTPLEWAARHGYTPILKLLLDRGANVNHADEDGNTALHFAAKNGSADAVRTLRSSGALPSVRNHDGQTPLDIATTLGRDSARDQLSKPK